MSKHLIEFTTDKRFIRRVRELKTIAIMVQMYCRHHHGGTPLCADCTALFDYAQRRLQRCVFGDTKPNCAKCAVHCYSADMREKIRIVMRWAGPRTLLRHPILGVLHLLADHRPIPMLPAKRQQKPQLRTALRAMRGTKKDSVHACNGNSSAIPPPM